MASLVSRVVRPVTLARCCIQGCHRVHYLCDIYVRPLCFIHYYRQTWV